MSLAAGAAQTAPAQRAQERKPDRVSERREDRRLERPTNATLSDNSRFGIDFARIPKGFVMEWKRHELMGMRDRRNQTIIRQFHWTPVPHKQQPHIYGETCQDENEHIVIDGLGLYMRPEYLNQDAEAERRDETDGVLKNQLQALRMESKAQVGEANTRIKRQVVQVAQPVQE